MSEKKQLKKKWSTDRIVTGSIIVLLIVLAMSLIPLEQHGEQILVPEEAGSEIFRALYSGGITSSNTILEGDAIKVSYQLPQNIRKENAELYILGVISSLAPEKQKTTITTYSGEKMLGEITVQMEDILRYKSRQTTLEEFEARFKTEGVN